MKRFLVIWLVISALLVMPAWAHIGSAGVVVEKQVGKYNLLVSIVPPDVIPGVAKVTVYVEQGRVTAIGARPIYFLSGDKGAPIHDELARSGAGAYQADVWLMDAGSSSIELSIDGPDGHQKVIVPVVSVATALREMPAGTGIGLAAMGLLLIAMFVTIIGASNADGVAASGQVAQPRLRRRRLAGMGVGLVLITLILTGWRTWWTHTAEVYRMEQLYQKPALNTTLSGPDNDRRLSMRLDTVGFGQQNSQKRRQLNYLIPDHGKLMHTFLVRVPGLDAFAHLHPIRHDSLQFDSQLPGLPAGKYLLFSDVVYRNGFSETLTDTVDIPTPTGAAAPVIDADDSWLVTHAISTKPARTAMARLDNTMSVCGKPSARVPLSDGSSMLWMDKPGDVLQAGKPYVLKFALADAKGTATPIEPYLGMSGHGVILHNDGSVYIHLHPVGTYSMAAEGSLVKRIADTARFAPYVDPKQFRDSIDRYVAQLKTLPEGEKNKALAAAMPSHEMKINNMVSFPYSFPKAGRYRVWVQVKRQGKVLTGVFDTDVDEPSM